MAIFTRLSWVFIGNLYIDSQWYLFLLPGCFGTSQPSQGQLLLHLVFTAAGIKPMTSTCRNNPINHIKDKRTHANGYHVLVLIGKANLMQRTRTLIFLITFKYVHSLHNVIGNQLIISSWASNESTNWSSFLPRESETRLECSKKLQQLIINNSHPRPVPVLPPQSLRNDSF